MNDNELELNAKQLNGDVIELKLDVTEPNGDVKEFKLDDKELVWDDNW